MVSDVVLHVLKEKKNHTCDILKEVLQYACKTI